LRTGSRLHGKVGLIVGATGEFGSKVARGFAAEGCNLVLASRTASTLDTIAEDIRESTGRSVSTCVVDLESRQSSLTLAADAWNAFGRIDVVMVSARPRDHLDTRSGTILTTKDDDWSWFLETIVVNPMLLIRDVVRRMIESGTRGSVITVISDSGIHPVPGVDGYGIAKGTLAVVIRYMAAEWGRVGIRVNALNPNGVLMGDGAESKEYLANLSRQFGVVNTMGRLGSGEELIPATVFLASDDSSYMTGQVLTLDGGMWLESAATMPPMYKDSSPVA
jgi:NAD(P)-dependent dehydrogenase (short-subunit alcohol dehydrogenase family)